MKERKISDGGGAEKAVDGYFASISYRVPAVVSHPPGRWTKGGVQWKPSSSQRERTGQESPKRLCGI